MRPISKKQVSRKYGWVDGWVGGISLHLYYVAKYENAYVLYPKWESLEALVENKIRMQVEQ
jgi:hypothetical protein